MVTLNDVKKEIANALAEEKAYGLPGLCVKYGLDDGLEEEAFRSKRSYVNKRLVQKDKEFILELGKKVMSEYPTSELARVVGNFFPGGGFAISSITREKLLVKINLFGNLEGKVDIIDFLVRVFDIRNIPSKEKTFETFEYDVIRHMRNNDDWDYLYLLKEELDLIYKPDDMFIYFLEQIVHPIIREQSEQIKYVNMINDYIEKDGYKLVEDDIISDEKIYKVKVTENKGVNGQVKNLIFASDGPKPEIIIKDSLNNDIKIVKNEEHCLVYYNKIGKQGLRWGELVEWWKCINKIKEDGIENEKGLYRRLNKTLGDGPEKKFFYLYYKVYKPILGENLPVLIPQVYLHYDPLTIRQLGGTKRLIHQRMDFLLLFSDRDRVVIEIDGKQHYSDDNISSPEKYSQMVSADRELTLNGYKVFRFGGYEFIQKDSEDFIIKFFHKLLSGYGFNLEQPLVTR